MNVKLCAMFLTLVAALIVQVARAQNAAAPPPPAPGEERGAEDSPSDQRPTLNGRTTRGYAPGQAPIQAPAQAPEKQAPAQAPVKGAMNDGGQPHVVGYAPCSNCQVTSAAPTTTYPRTTYRRGIFRRGYR